MNPRTITNRDEMNKLDMVAKMLEYESPNNAQYIVRDVYFDFGQNWMWTTIVRRGWQECQVLNPKEWGDILMADSVKELAEVAEEIRNGKYFGDR